MQGDDGQKGEAGAAGPSGPLGLAGKDGVGPPPSPPYVEPGDWPKGQCYALSDKCSRLGITDNLCGECLPACDRCDADVGFKLRNPEGLRFDAATFDEETLGKGSVQV